MDPATRILHHETQDLLVKLIICTLYIEFHLKPMLHYLKMKCDFGDGIAKYCMAIGE